ncbi:proteasome subunit alpha [Pseudonocardia phyllosphaerae]|uniref:proteasome subunit alpha n=1 Tax=Pseudonocardia phyllosphaerae TaxID=3390502 RepID=UPI00397818E7
MTMPFYSSVDQLLRDRSELARKGISRGRSVVALTYSGGVLFVAENRGTSLRKVSEIYDRIGFAAVGRYNEFENLRTAGIRMADFRGFTYDRRDVTGRMLANAYAQVLGTSFVEQQKPFEVELCVADVGARQADDHLYRITYDGSITDEPRYIVMGGQTEPISTKLGETYDHDLDLPGAIGVALGGLQVPGADPASSGNGSSEPRLLGADALEVAILDRSRPRRTFRRIEGDALTELLPAANRGTADGEADIAGGDDSPAAGGALDEGGSS